MGKGNEKEPLLSALWGASEVEIDALWAILKYHEIGIFRKVHCMSVLLRLPFEDALMGLPMDGQGRVLDHKTRRMIHDVLIKVSQNG